MILIFWRTLALEETNIYRVLDTFPYTSVHTASSLEQEQISLLHCCSSPWSHVRWKQDVFIQNLVQLVTGNLFSFNRDHPQSFGTNFMFYLPSLLLISLNSCYFNLVVVLFCKSLFWSGYKQESWLLHGYPTHLFTYLINDLVPTICRI